MNEHAEDPVGHASSKIVQYVSLATMAAEAIAQVRQQRAAAAAAVDERAAGALRAQQISALAAARLQWKPVLDPRRSSGLGLGDAGLAWAATQAWRDADPEAELACRRAQERLRELRPDVMDRYDRLTGDGLDPVEAMRRVGPFFDRPQAWPAQPVTRPTLAADSGGAFSIEVDGALRTAAAAAGAAGDQRGRSAEHLAVVDDPSTPAADERLDARKQADPHLAAAATHDSQAADLQPAAELSLSRSRTPPQVAKDGYPEPLTSEVLAAGRVKANTPDRTAPAAVRSNGLATAARAAASRAR